MRYRDSLRRALFLVCNVQNGFDLIDTENGRTQFRIIIFFPNKQYRPYIFVVSVNPL